MNRINLLQEKNDNCFGEYLANQRVMMELDLLMKISLNRGERRTS